MDKKVCKECKRYSECCAKWFTGCEQIDTDCNGANFDPIMSDTEIEIRRRIAVLDYKTQLKEWLVDEFNVTTCGDFPNDKIQGIVFVMRKLLDKFKEEEKDDSCFCDKIQNEE